jgi:hypothetical protein
MGKCYVKAYYDWIEQTAALSDAERGRLFVAILEYARSGLDPKLDGREGLLFPVFRTMVDRDAQKSEVYAQNGKLGGRGNKANESNQKLNKANESNQKPTKDIRHKTQDKGHRTQESPPLIPPRGGKRDAFADFAGEDAELYATLRDYAEMRTKIKKPMTERAKQLACTKLQELSGGDRRTAIMIVEQSIANSWQGLFPLKRQEGFQQKTANPFLEMLREEESR